MMPVDPEWSQKSALTSSCDLILQGSHTVGGVGEIEERRWRQMPLSPSHHVSQECALSRLFLTFLKLGVTAFGGPAMLAYIRAVVVEQKHWLTDETLRAGIALCQTIPGATAMQLAAYVGLRMRGVAGAAVSFLGFGLPAFLLMLALSAFYVRVSSLPTALAALHGLRVLIVAIVANATRSFGRTALHTWRDALMALVGAGLFGWGLHPILVILVSAFFGRVLVRHPFLPPLAGAADRPARMPRALLSLVALTVVGCLLLFLVDRRLFALALLMFRLDVFAFGSGFASVPLMFHEIVEVRAWMDGPTFLDGIALGQITPGPIVITATFVGYVLYDVLGAIIATISVFLPSFVIVIGIVPYFDRLRRSRAVQQALSGIVCAAVGLMFTVTVRLAWEIPWDLPRAFLASAAFVALWWQVDLLWVVVLGTALAVLIL
jgi:chromate transporter